MIASLAHRLRPATLARVIVAAAVVLLAAPQVAAACNAYDPHCDHPYEWPYRRDPLGGDPRRCRRVLVAAQERVMHAVGGYRGVFPRTCGAKIASKGKATVKRKPTTAIARPNASIALPNLPSPNMRRTRTWT